MQRAWIKVEDIVKLESVSLPPKAANNLKPGLKAKWKKILQQATECAELSREKRLENFSFAALFKGKWGYYDENTKVVKEKSKIVLVNEEIEDVEKEPEVLKGKEWKPSDLLNLWNNNSIVQKVNIEDWSCDICSKYFPYVQNIIKDHLKFHHIDMQVSINRVI